MNRETSIKCAACGKVIMRDEGFQPLRWENGHMTGVHRESCKSPLSGDQTKLYAPDKKTIELQGEW